MATVLSKSPVPVRMSIRYTNGMVLTHAARALSYDETALRVLSSQPFEKGTTLTVLAPFFEGIATCWVFGVANSPEQPGFYEMILQFVKKPILVSPSVSQPVSKPPPARRKQLRQADRAAMQESIERLITGLYRLPPPPFSEVLRELPPESRSATLVAAAAAVIFLLQGKGLVNTGRLIQHVREATQK